MKINYFLNTKSLSDQYKSMNTSFDKEIVNNYAVSPQGKACKILSIYLSCKVDNLSEMDIENIRVCLFLLDENITPNSKIKNITPVMKEIKNNKCQLKDILISKLNEYSITHEVV